MIKKFTIEIFVFTSILLLVLFNGNIDLFTSKHIGIYTDTSQGKIFKNFFIQITTLGNSLWYFLFSILIFIFSLIFFFKNKIKKTKEIRMLSLFVFFGLLITGIITQIIKHIIGRPRPNHVSEDGITNFNFFSLDSSFHSFPSGHTSTIYFICLVLCVISPKLKFFYFFLASIIALSRVVVEAHFLLDVFGGFVVSIIGFKLTNEVFNFFKIKINFKIFKIKNYYIFLQLLLLLLFVIILLSVGNNLDLYISSLAYKGDSQFYLQSYDLVVLLFRKIILPLLILYLIFLTFLSLFLPIKLIYLNYKIKIREFFFIFISLFFNLILVVNLLLKDMWGRARPNDIINFGGEDNFTAWFEFSDACSKNCSFVSGDSSVGFSIIIFYFLSKKIIFFWLSLFFGFSLGLVRILEGGHFISDIIISNFIIFSLTFIQFYFYNKYFKKNAH